MCLTTFFSVVILIPVELGAAVLILYVMLVCCYNLLDVVDKRLLPALERRRGRRRERRRMEHVSQAGDVTTELATAPGEAPSRP